jgi:hypothetical protein
MKRKVIFILLIITGFYSQAQVSGYQGKRFLLNYHQYFMSALTGPNQNGENGVTSFNLHNRVGFDFVLSRSLCMGLDFHFFKTCFKFQNTSIDYFDPIYGIYSSADLNISGMLGYSSVTGIGIHLKKYFVNNIAPLGNYFEFEIVDFFQSVSYNKEKLQAQNPLIVLDIPNLSPYNSAAISISYGKKSIFFNRLVFDYGMQTGIVFNGFTSELSFSNTHFDMNTYFDESVKSRLFSHYIFNIHLGLGLLVL